MDGAGAWGGERDGGREWGGALGEARSNLKKFSIFERLQTIALYENTCTTIVVYKNNCTTMVLYKTIAQQLFCIKTIPQQTP